MSEQSGGGPITRDTATRLEELLDLKDTEIESLREKLEKAKDLLRSARSGWAQPREGEDDGATPVPRLEFEWTQLHGDWYSYAVEYRLVTRHLLGHLLITPLGHTTVNGGAGRPPYEMTPLEQNLPYRDGAHSQHDSAHLGLPLYAVLPSGRVRIRHDKSSAHAKGAEHRRAEVSHG